MEKREEALLYLCLFVGRLSRKLRMMLCNASMARFEAANRRKQKSFLPPSLRICVVVVLFVCCCFFTLSRFNPASAGKRCATAPCLHVSPWPHLLSRARETRALV